MNSRQRFREIIHYGAPDRVPYFEEGIREEVLQAWYGQGLSPDRDLSDIFPTDRREEIAVDLDPHPEIKKWPTSSKELTALVNSLHPYDPDRLPENWSACVRGWRNRDHLLMLRVHRGLFTSMGVGDWRRFREVILMVAEYPEFVKEIMTIRGRFSADLAERVLREVDVDAAIFSEPIGGNDRPLISPRTYEEIVLPSYEPVLDVLKNHGVEVIIFRTYANARVLLPSIIKWGFNCLWACEVNIAAMDYRHIRRQFGPKLRLIGGIDLDTLRHDKEAIRREVKEKVPPLLDEGGYIPLADGRIREDVPFENYVYYRKLLETITRP